MLRLTHSTQRYAWGSTTAIPDLLGTEQDGSPVAEAWFGAHSSAPAMAETSHGARRLDELIATSHVEVLGEGVIGRFGSTLPYLLKVIAAERPLSLQVHPRVERARAGYAAEDAAGVPLTAPDRNYRDPNHKPELVYALTQFEALCGFRAPRRAAELFAGLDVPLAKELHGILADEPSADGIRAVFEQLLHPSTRPSAEEVAEIAAACAERLAAGSPSPRSDRTVVLLQRAYPGDLGVVTSLLLNPVTLKPGEALFVPAGGVHAYLSGVAVEIMASSDNVLRAGLTPKHVDVPELLDNVDYVAAPPIRIAPETFHDATKVFYAPVDDFELSVTEVRDGAEHPLPGRGPRIVLCLSGGVTLRSGSAGDLDLVQGQSAFVPASDGALCVAGSGTIVQADVP
ncbi:mannose-6-phosphate isomerase, class I [Cellulomonas sp. McL0617]|uniref:mannose-6-phosphate isomerase, class I n=1 Tax=Cellulomonas sp. McL0617 TaxID=3415675 RepID=UPI003CF0053B